MDNQEQGTGKHGGKRQGAGRKPLDYNAKYFAARGIKPLHAAEILAHVADERAIWKRLLTSEDDGIVLRAMAFLVSMRDGKPAQQINIRSISVSYTAEDIEKARAVVRELVRPVFALEEKANIEPTNQSVNANRPVGPNAVEDQGVKKDG